MGFLVSLVADAGGGEDVGFAEDLADVEAPKKSAGTAELEGAEALAREREKHTN